MIATAVCARRTDTALDRYRSFSRAPDVYVGTGLTFGLQALDLAGIRRLPQVRAVSRGVLPNADVLRGGGGDVDAPVQLEVLPDPDGLEVVDRPKLLAGRLPTPGHPDEVVADARAMRTAHLALGDTLTVRLRLGRRAVAGTPIALRIVGVRPDMSPEEAGSFVSATPGSFYRAHGGSRIAVAALRNALKVRLWHGTADVPAFERGAERLAHGHDFQFTPFDVGARTMQSGLHLQAQALWAAAILGVSALWLLTGQGVARMLERETRNDPTLLALGMTLGELRRLALARALLIGGMVVVVTLPVAVGLSPLGPFGRARDLEPDPWYRDRSSVLVGGAAVVLLGALLPGVIAAWRAGRTRSYLSCAPALPPGPPRVTSLARAGLPPVLVTGTRMALPRQALPDPQIRTRHDPRCDARRRGHLDGPDLRGELLASAAHAEAVGTHVGLRERPGIRHGARSCADPGRQRHRRSSIRGGREARHRGTPGRRRGLRRHQGSCGTDGHRRSRAAARPARSCSARRSSERSA